MPLSKSTNPKAVSQNIREMVASGHPQKQAVAAALSTLDAARKEHHMQRRESRVQEATAAHKRAMGQ